MCKSNRLKYVLIHNYERAQIIASLGHIAKVIEQKN